MSTTYATPPGLLGEDINHAIDTIRRQRFVRLLGALGGLVAVVVVLVVLEVAMLSQVETPTPMLDPQPGQEAPYEPD